MSASAPSAVRLTDLLDALSLAVDLGLGQPMRHVSRSAVIAGRLGELVGLDAAEQADLMHVSRLGWLGCIADSRDAAAWFGDDIDYRAGVYDVDMRPLPFLGYLVRSAGSADPAPTRLAKRAGVLLDGGRSVQQSLRTHCQVTASVAQQLGLDRSVREALGQIVARWDGKGLPDLRGDEIARVVRLWHVADVAEVHARRGGPAEAEQVLRARSGTQFDPAVVKVFCAHAQDLLTEPIEEATELAATGAPHTFRPLSPDELDHALCVIGDWVDLKSAWFSGHSRGVAELAYAAAVRLGLDAAACTLVRHAGYTHDLGRIGVSNQIWDREGRLTGADTERVRLHSYYTERMLTDRPGLATVGRIAGMCHERLDGSGYHRGLTASAIPMEARVLAAADCFHTKLERRPHRAALTSDEAAAHLVSQVRDGKLDKSASDAVLEAAGRRRRTRLANPAGLTDREVDVLRLLATGCTNKQIATRLSISPKTVSNHVEHLYAKAGVSSRAGATLFAMEHAMADPLVQTPEMG